MVLFNVLFGKWEKIPRLWAKVIDCTKGALIGGGGGAVVGGSWKKASRKEQKKEKKKWEKEQTAEYSQKRSTYNRAYSACLEGKGYTVK